MDNLRKIGLTALGTALVSTASFAGDMAVTGTAKIILQVETILTQEMVYLLITQCHLLDQAN